MKYYIGEYWAMMNSSNSDTREEGKIKWDETAKEYGPYFRLIRDKLPKKFMKEFDRNSWFHDFMFDSINIANTGNKTATVEFVIAHAPITYKIVFSGVTGFTLNVPNTLQCWSFGKLTWGYVEFELHDDKTWTISILCDIDCEVEIHFSKIGIEKLN